MAKALTVGLETVRAVMLAVAFSSVIRHPFWKGLLPPRLTKNPAEDWLPPPSGLAELGQEAVTVVRCSDGFATGLVVTIE